jgi:HAD superfamily hydrolase (TIGR01509 family)
MIDPRVLLFDLGGVLVETSSQAALHALLPQMDKMQILARWHTCRSVGLFERGSISPKAFASMFVAEWQLPVEPAEFLGSFALWVRGFYPGAESLLRRLRKQHRIACLSNTNAVHWSQLSGIPPAFDVCIASHLTGHMKPDCAAYEQALSTLATPAREVYFFDDLLPNVVAARSIGIQAFQVRGLSETEAALRSLGMACDADAAYSPSDRTPDGAVEFKR